MDILDTWHYGCVRQESNHLGNFPFYLEILRRAGRVVVEDSFIGAPKDSEKMSGTEAASYINKWTIHDRNNGCAYRFRAHERAVIIEFHGHDIFGRFRRRIVAYPTD